MTRSRPNCLRDRPKNRCVAVKPTKPLARLTPGALSTAQQPLEGGCVVHQGDKRVTESMVPSHISRCTVASILEARSSSSGPGVHDESVPCPLKGAQSDSCRPVHGVFGPL